MAKYAEYLFHCPKCRTDFFAPQKKEWVGLTDEEIMDKWIDAMQNTKGTALPIPEFARAIEAKLKEKNT